MTRSSTVTSRRTVVPPGLAEYFWRTQLGGLVEVARRRPEASGAIVFGVLAAAVYLYSSSRDRENLDYFVRLADAFLHGRLTVPEAPSWLNELIPTEGGWFVPYPPMPAILMVPVVAVFGTSIHQQVVSALLGAVDVALVWLVLGQFSLALRVRAFLTAVFGFGTVMWYVAEVGSVWYLAHVVAIGFALVSLLLALHGRWAFACGLLLGCAAISRLPVALTAPAILAYLLRLGWPPPITSLTRAQVTRSVVFLTGLALPLAGYGVYNLARFGNPLDFGYTRIPGVLEDQFYTHGILAFEYIPRNLYAILFRSWNFVDQAPFLQPSWWGLSVFFATPLFLWLVKARLHDARTAYAVLGIALTAIPILTHGNVGVTQYGYRFSLDVQPLLFVVLAVVFQRGVSRLAILAGVLGILSSAYAIWAISLGFVAF